MHAALVTSFDQPPHYADVAEPDLGPHEVVVEVLAAGLHPRVRSQADGSHYTSTDELPLIPGIDGVGRRGDGSLLYFVLPDTRFGTMAERVAVDARRAVELPADADPVLLAAAMNPAMSSWVALRRRVAFHAGQHVMILGATGNAGQLAIQVARQLGAAQVVAVGRGPALGLLPDLGADVVLPLDGDPRQVAADLGNAAADIDVVLDYLWGAPTANAIAPVVVGRTDSARSLDWVQIGSVAGPDITLPSAALRAANLRLLGSGQGSVSPAGILGELPELAELITTGAFAVHAEATPLSDVEKAWTAAPVAGNRVVLCP
jgi:NADPH:quinone reductase-like Zn-dependent oxidoreductase